LELVAYAIPLILVLVALEAWVGHARGNELHRLNDSVSGFSCGALDQIVNVAVLAVFLGAYASLERRFGLVPLEVGSVAGWIVAFFGYDLAYYAFHRASHRVNFLWAAHIVHHQSEEYNLAVSLRQGAIATWVTYLFYLPLAFVGVPPAMFLAVHGIYQVYQFFVHTRLVGKLGPLEWIFATPSLHRVHHGRAPEHLDKNYGGFLNVWDRLFGSFALERGEPAFGITTGIRAWSPFWANFHYYAELFQTSKRAPTLASAVWVWLAPPEWKAPWQPDPPPHDRYDARPVRAFEPYLLLQLAHAVVGGSFLLLKGETLNGWVHALLSGLVLSTLFTVGAFFDRKPWAAPVEGVRTFVVACVFAGLDALGQLSPVIAAIGYVPALASLGACIALASHAHD
jgi:sterol desaturase/sphingolipid hydroxylase (fatty acid hydroxylase superfamily)